MQGLGSSGHPGEKRAGEAEEARGTTAALYPQRTSELSLSSQREASLSRGKGLSRSGFLDPCPVRPPQELTEAAGAALLDAPPQVPAKLLCAVLPIAPSFTHAAQREVAEHDVVRAAPRSESGPLTAPGTEKATGGSRLGCSLLAVSLPRIRSSTECSSGSQQLPGAGAASSEGLAESWQPNPFLRPAGEESTVHALFESWQLPACCLA